MVALEDGAAVDTKWSEGSRAVMAAAMVVVAVVWLSGVTNQNYENKDSNYTPTGKNILSMILWEGGGVRYLLALYKYNVVKGGKVHLKILEAKRGLDTKTGVQFNELPFKTVGHVRFL